MTSFCSRRWTPSNVGYARLWLAHWGRGGGIAVDPALACSMLQAWAAAAGFSFLCQRTSALVTSRRVLRAPDGPIAWLKLSSRMHQHQGHSFSSVVGEDVVGRPCSLAVGSCQQECLSRAAGADASCSSRHPAQAVGGESAQGLHAGPAVRYDAAAAAVTWHLARTLA